MERYEYTPRVTRAADGAYRWRGTFSDAQRLQVVKIVVGVCGGTCLLFVLMGLMMGGDMMLPILLSCLGVMVIAGGISGLYYRFSKGQTQPYEMTDEYIRYVGYSGPRGSRTDTYYHFKDIRRVKIRAAQNCIQVHSLMSASPFFVPHEDFAFVQNFVLQRLNDTTTVEYE